MSSPDESASHSPSTSWHIPGPSSRYHKRQWTQPSKHARFASSPEAEVGRSSAFTAHPHASRTSSPLSHFTSLRRAHTAPMDGEGPLTPMRSPHHTAHIPHDSPFSDYFTDEARSVSHKGAYNMPSQEVQRILLRLNNLGAHVLRQPSSNNAVELFGDKLDELERMLGGVERSPRARRTMSDSGFVDDISDSQIFETSPKLNGSQLRTLTSPTAAVRAGAEEADDEEAHNADRDRMLGEAQMLLERVAKVNDDLRQRFDEMRELNDQQAYQVEESAREALELRSENEALKADLGFDHSELLFLKLQLKALELQAGEVYVEDEETDQERGKRLDLEGEMDQWKSTWDDVDARQRVRRLTHRVMSSTPNDLVRHREDGKAPDEQGDWKLDLSKKRSGRVQSITIRRFSSPQLNHASEDETRGIDISTNSTADGPSITDSSTQTDAGADLSDSRSQTCVNELHEQGVQTDPDLDARATASNMEVANSAVQTESYVASSLTISKPIVLYCQAYDEVAPAQGQQPAGKSEPAHEENATSKEEPSSRGLPKKEVHVAQGTEVKGAQEKTPWQELVDSLADFAGMTER